MKRIWSLLLAATIAAPATAHAERVVSLRGSPASMQEQNRVAKDHGLTFYRTPAQIHAAVERGELVELRGNDDYAVADFVRYPYLQPETALFVERLAAQYREECGQRLVVTSGVRPTTQQPSNSHALSVHPAGMAVDLRVSDRASCRSWLESAILNLNREGVINGIREFRPPHYHVAVYPTQYMAYAQERMAQEAEERLLAEAAEAAEAEALALEMLAQAASAHRSASAPDGREGGAEVAGPTADGRSLALAMMIVAVPVGLGLMLKRRRRS